ncbi:CLUMA_CG021448, isoform A [Clunio marinus]|uniref:CLUMA_CG021448, isoform A n=1 Tax=Clunio marinus TaxID=568069 RepID=A0A1J1J869_9DIPT|nr:CLUMA_CG021448, isoform A [Clunio marinus]
MFITFFQAKLPHWSSGQVSELNASVLLQVPGSSPGMDKKKKNYNELAVKTFKSDLFYGDEKCE